jgi:hypothetical protein
LVRKRHKSIDAVDKMPDYLVGGEAIFDKEFPNFGKAAADFKVKSCAIMSLAPPASGRELLSEVGNHLIAGNGFHLATFQIVITATEHFARLREFGEVSGEGVLNQFLGRTPRLADPLIDFGLQFWREM